MNEDSRELIVTRSYTTEDSYCENSDAGAVYISGEEVPSHWRLMLAELFSCRNKKPRFIKSRGAILVLVITCMINISFNGALGDILGKVFRDVVHVKEAGILISLAIIFVRSIPQLAYPLAGWIADAHCGRYKVILASLWLMLSGYLLILLTFLLKYYYDTTAIEYAVYLVLFPAAFLAINIGLAAFQANIIPFGLDQMPDGSTEEISAFIYWYYGSRNIIAGVIPLSACYISSSFELTSVLIALCEVTCVALAISLCYCFKKSLIIEPNSINPFKLLHKVLKFAIKNKYPLSRSAFTFWEDEIPSRVDLAKSKYGGPCTNEEVEDVKTFFRTTGVLVSISVFMIGYYTLLLVVLLFSHKLENVPYGTCRAGIFYQILLDTFPVFIMVVVFEAVIYPLFKVCIPSMLRRVGIGMCVSIAGLLVLLVLDVYGYDQKLYDGGVSNFDSVEDYFATSLISNGSNGSGLVEYSCYLVNGSTEQQVDINVSVISAVILLAALAETLIFIAALEFIASQSPYGMRGMLIGAFYCIRGVFGFLTALLFLAFTLGSTTHPLQLHGISCGLPLIATVVTISLVGLTTFIAVAKNYKQRERPDSDEQFDTRPHAEKYYYGSVTTSY